MVAASARLHPVRRWVLLFLPLLMSIPAPAQPGHEVLLNGGFDQDAQGRGLPDGWSTSSKQIIYRETVPHSRDWEIVSRPGVYVLATQDIKLTPGETYTLIFEAKGTADALAGAIILHGPARPTTEMGLIWSQPVKPDYQTFFRVFRAPSPACRLYLYNVARKGEVVYRRISLRQGRPEEPLVRQLSFGPADEPDEAPRVTPHTPFARPLAGGPLKALIAVRNIRSAREVVELAQRCHLDWDLLQVTGDDVCSPTAQRAQQRLDHDGYDVYVINTPLPTAFQKAVTKAVSAGRGLVLCDAAGKGQGLCRPEQLAPADEQGWLLRELPWSRLAEAYRPAVRCGEVGAGRVVHLAYPAATVNVWAVAPVLKDQSDWQSRTFRSWEYPDAFLARCLTWAARRDNKVTVQVTADAQGLTQRAAELPPRAQVEVRQRPGRELRWDGPEQSQASAQPAADGRVPYPAGFPGGPAIADVRVLDADGKVLYWAGLPYERPREGQLGELVVTPEAVAPDGQVTVTARSTAPLATVATVRLVDALGRVCEQRTLPVAAQGDIRCTLPVARTRSAGNKLLLRLCRADGWELDSAWRAVWVPALNRKLAWDDFHVTAWGDGAVQPAISHTYNQMIRELGLNGKLESYLYGTVEDGLWPTGMAHLPGLFPAGPRPDRHRGAGCLSDPAFLERTDAAFSKRIADARALGMSAWALGDEIELTSRHDVDEVDFSPASLAAFRAWLQRQYGSLEALNQQWGTRYASFTEAQPGLSGDVRGKGNFAPFVDFRAFMTEEWIRVLTHIVGDLKAKDPGALVGHTNTFGSLPFNGVDYWRLCHECGFTWGQEYSEAIKPEAQKAVFAFWRSFLPDAFPNLGWIGYHRNEYAAQFEPWWLALHGSRGVSYFAVNAVDAQRGNSWALVHPTQAFTPYARWVKASLRDLVEGDGKLLMESSEPQPEVAILWSHPSMLASWCESTWEKPEPPDRAPYDAWGAFFRAQLNFRQLLEANQIPYRYVAPQQLAADPSLLRRYKVVYLPFVSACDRATIATLAAWTRQGGWLIGDLNLLRYDQHGTPWTGEAPLAELFGVRADGPPVWQATQLTGVLTANGFGWQPLTALRPLATPLGSVVRHEGGAPAVLASALGQGRTVVLNTLLDPDDGGGAALIGRLMQQAGVARPVQLTRLDDPSQLTACEVLRRVNGSIELLGLIRDYRRVSRDETAPPPLRLTLSRPAWVVDVRGRKLLGQLSQLDLRLAPAETRLLALLPYRPERLTLTLPETASAGGELALQAALQADGTPGRHVFRVELRAPGGATRYAGNHVAEVGRIALRLPLAYNDPPGAWTITVRDVTSGLSSTVSFRVMAPAG